MCDLEDLSDGMAHIDALASWMELAWENSLSAPYYLAGFVMGEPVRQTPRRGDRLFGPATAAKEEAAVAHE
jgi:hypothetical protein